MKKGVEAGGVQSVSQGRGLLPSCYLPCRTKSKGLGSFLLLQAPPTTGRSTPRWSLSVGFPAHCRRTKASISPILRGSRSVALRTHCQDEGMEVS